MPPFIAEYACGKGSRKPYATGSAAIYRSGMHGDEKRVVDAFVAWLLNEGWTAEKEVNFADVFARRGDERLYAEAKGRTREIGLDVDTLYGQLLRRMTDRDDDARYAVVVPAAAVPAALRVPDWVREGLKIDVYEVDDAGQVHLRARTPS